MQETNGTCTFAAPRHHARAVHIPRIGLCLDDERPFASAVAGFSTPGAAPAQGNIASASAGWPAAAAAQGTIASAPAGWPAAAGVV